MSDHLNEVSLEAIRENKKLTFPLQKSNKSRVIGKLRYWWCWFAASIMLLFIATPALIFLLIINLRTLRCPLSLWTGESVLSTIGWRYGERKRGLKRAGQRLKLRVLKTLTKIANTFLSQIIGHTSTPLRFFAMRASESVSWQKKSYLRRQSSVRE